MSTPAVKAAIVARITELADPVRVIDVSGYASLDDLPKDVTEQCVLVDFPASSEEISTIGDPATLGFEETGTVSIEWLYQRGFDPGPAEVAAETMRLALRGTEVGDIRIESIQPFIHSRSRVESRSKWAGLASLLYYELDSFQ